ncbi:MAG: DUF805 domain-containing protein [Clostridia bacterium]
MSHYLNALKNYANFKGRTRRREYWFFMLFNSLFFIAIFLFFLVITAILSSTAPQFASSTFFLYTYFAVLGGYFLAMIVPTVSITFRRMHDSGHSGWLVVIPYILFPLYIVLTLTKLPAAVVCGLFINMAAFIISIMIFAFSLLDSSAGSNKYGDSTKYPAK